MKVIALDSSILIGDNLGFASGKYQELKKLSQAGKIKILVPDVIVREVKANIRSGIEEAKQSHKSFITKARILRNLPHRFPKLFDEFPHEEMQSELLKQFDQYLKSSQAVILDTSHLCAPEIMDKYFNGVPPFKIGGVHVLKSDDKRFEFPDAIALSAIEEWSRKNKSAVEVHEIHIEKAAKAKIPYLKKIIEKKVSGFGFYLGALSGDVKDVRNFKAGDIEISLLAYEAKSGQGTLWVTGKVLLHADVVYGDDSSALWDHENQELIYRQSVDKTIEYELNVEAEVKFQYSSKTKELTITSLDLFDPQGDIDLSL